jgi:GT2 family glycosyltransferase
MSDNLIVSVIVLGYNEKNYLADCFSAVLDQDLNNEFYEVIFVDNASVDGSSEWVKDNYPDVRIVRLEQNLGFGGGNNRGAEIAKTDLVVFLNADTVVHRSWLKQMVETIKSDPQIKACVSGGLAPDLPGFNPKERIDMPDYVYYGDIVRFGHVGLKRIRRDSAPRSILHLGGCSAMLDLSILDKLEYIFDETFFLDNDDTDLSIRINSLGYKVVVAPGALFYHLVKTVPGDLKISSRTLKRMVGMHRNRFVVYFRNMDTLEFLLALPILLFGSPLKPITFNITLWRKIIYALAIIPVTWYSLILALLTRFPQQKEKRRRILEKRQTDRFWLLNLILFRKGTHDHN